MDAIQELQRFLAGALREAAPRERAEPRPFITLSRQAGAGGHSLAEAILAEMGRREDEPALRGWRVVDRELCERVAADPKVRVSMETLVRERYRPELEELMTELIAGTTPQAAVARRIFELLRGLALTGKVILVGRAGACAAGGLEGGVHVRVVASAPVRESRLAERLGLGREEARRQMAELDGSRALLVRSHFLRDVEDPLLYDLVLNSGRMTFAEMAGSVVELVLRRVESLRRERAQA